MDYSDRIQSIRKLLEDAETAFTHFGRRAEEKLVPGAKLGSFKVSKMIRYASEEDFAKVCAKLAEVRVAVNSLSADVEDALDEAREEHRWYDEDEDREES